MIKGLATFFIFSLLIFFTFLLIENYDNKIFIIFIKAVSYMVIIVNKKFNQKNM